MNRYDWEAMANAYRLQSTIFATLAQFFPELCQVVESLDGSISVIDEHLKVVGNDPTYDVEFRDELRTSLEPCLESLSAAVAVTPVELASSLLEFQVALSDLYDRL
jgi:hypothetical protein